MEKNILFYLITGITFGLAAGFAPGPLFTLVISETLQLGRKAGYAVAISPLITDIPIILFITFLVHSVSDMPVLISLIAFGGATYLFYLGYKSIRIKTKNSTTDEKNSSSLIKGVVTNFLNPHPYLFWLVVGSPILVGSLTKGIASPIAFLLGLYSMLIGSKLFIAWLTAKTGKFLADEWYIYVNRGLGVVLIFFGIMFILKAFTV